MELKIIIFIILLPSIFFAQTKSLKIMTINVWSGLDYNGTFKMGEYESPDRREERFKILLAEIRKTSPDIIFLQEANPIDKYVKRLADSLSFDEIHQVCNAGIKFGPIGIPSNFKEGMVILADPKFKLNYFDTWKLGGSFGLFGDLISFHFNESNFALVGKINVDGSVFYLINIHLNANVPPDSSIRIKYENYCKQNSIGNKEFSAAVEKWDDDIQKKDNEFEELTEKIKDLPAEYPFIMGGDFNTASTNKRLKSFIKENKLTDTFINNTYSKTYTWYPVKNENINFSTKLSDAEGNKLKGYDVINAFYDSVPRRIDYILLDHHFNKREVEGYRIILNSTSNGINASDHFGVLSQINISNVAKNIPKEFEYLVSSEDHTIEPLPIISYDTDVGFGYGAKAFFLNLLKHNESFDITLFNSTKGEKWYRFVFSIPDFELRQGKVYPLALDFIVDYDKYIRNSFFGTGNKSSYSDMEEYTKEPLEIDLNLNRGFSKNIVGQFGLKYKTVRNFNFSDTSKLLFQPSGLSSSKANFTSINLSFRYDTRNSFINPSKGLVLLGETEYAPKLSFTNTTFARYAGWLQYYSILFYPNTIFAFRTGLQTLAGKNLPVQVLLPIGGNNTLRGYPQDRFLDKTDALINAELRFPIFWRFGGILGFDAGKVWHSISKIDLKNWPNNPVFGLRFYMDTYVIRLDVGLGKEITGFYFNFGQIF
jgi:endonuclease/exonuclease/phosphatase family metal-dependent hydrolase